MNESVDNMSKQKGMIAVMADASAKLGAKAVPLNPTGIQETFSANTEATQAAQAGRASRIYGVVGTRSQLITPGAIPFSFEHSTYPTSGKLYSTVAATPYAGPDRTHGIV